MRTSADPSRVAVKAWMRQNVKDFVDPKTGEVNTTELAESAAQQFDKNDLGGWLDDETHWVWDISVEVAESFEKSNKKKASSEHWESAEKLILEGSNGNVNKILNFQLGKLADQTKEIQASFLEAAKTLETHKRLGVGRTESPSLLLEPLREMTNFSKSLLTLSSRVETIVEGALKKTGGRLSDL